MGYRTQGFINIKEFGAAGDGVTDDTPFILAALAYLEAHDGGHLFFPSGNYIVDGLWRFPNDGQPLPTQNPIRISGEAPFKSATGAFTPAGGTIIDLRYGGADAARIITNGVGTLTIENITFQSINASASIPFLFTTNTILNIRNCGFFGRNGVAAADETAIVLGAQTAVPVIDGTDDAPFQGYGTVIEGNWFNQIERGILGGTYCNGVVIRDNTWWNRCGGECAIEIGELLVGGASGNVISGNLIEMVGYNYGIKLVSGNLNSLVFNNFYDPGGSVVTYIDLDPTSGFNTIIEGFTSGFQPSYIDDSEQSIFISANQAVQSNFTQGLRANGIDVWGNIGPRTHHQTNGRYVYPTIAGLGVYYSVFDSGELQLFKGEKAGTPVYFSLMGGDNNRFAFTDGGVHMTSSTGSPEGVKTASVGSMYLRSDGGAGTTLYIKESGSGNTGWVAK